MDDRIAYDPGPTRPGLIESFSLAGPWGNPTEGIDFFNDDACRPIDE
jgi:hypothetical protein